MLVLFAKNDIDQDNLKVKAGHPLPSRFQQSFLTRQALERQLGKDAIIPLTADTQGYVLVETKRLADLESENANLKQQLAERSKKLSGTDKRETQ